MTKFHVLTLFPEMILQGLSPGVIGRAAEKNIISLHAVNIRDYTLDRHGKADDYPYGGGAGMLMQAQPVCDAHRAVAQGRAVRTVYVTPQGVPFTQKFARELAREEELIFLCGHYEGIDERALEEVVTDYVSIGDYVLTGGELPAMVMIDAIARLVPGVLGNDSSAEEESFHNDLLEYPQYSRPEVWNGKRVPEVLLSGDHRRVAAWRLEQSVARTAVVRPDLYAKYEAKQRLIRYLSFDRRNNIHMTEGLAGGRYEILCAEGRPEEISAKECGGKEPFREMTLLLYDDEQGICMAMAQDEAAGRRLADMLPADAVLAVTSQPFLRDMIARRGYRVSDEYIRMIYTGRETLPVRHKDVRRLTADHLPYVREHCRAAGDDDSYIMERVLAGAVYGAFAGDRLLGFAGMHIDGCMGMLFVEEDCRRQGVAASLEGYLANRLLEKGRTPYVYVCGENGPAVRLQEKLGFYRAQKTFWRLELEDDLCVTR